MIRELKDSIEFEIKVITNSSKDLIFLKDDKIKVKITASPIEGKANKAIIGLFSEFLNIPKINIEIIKGLSSKNKVVRIRDISKSFFLSKLSESEK